MNNQSIDSLKGLAIIGVVICHIAFVNKLDHKTIDEIYTLQYIFSWCVMGFFFCSGYLEKQWNGEFLAWSIKKIKRLLIPLFIFELTYKLILMLSSNLYSQNLDIDWNQFLSYSAPQTYYLFVLFILFVALKLINYIVRFESGSLFFLVFLVLLFSESPNIAYGNDILLYPYYLLCMLSGVIVRSKEECFSSMIAVLFCFAVALFAGTDVLVFTFVPMFVYAVFKIISPAEIMRPLKALGKYSSSIYIWHTPIILPFFLMIALPFLGKGWFTVITSSILTLILCIAIKRITSKYFLFKMWDF